MTKIIKSLLSCEQIPNVFIHARSLARTQHELTQFVLSSPCFDHVEQLALQTSNLTTVAATTTTTIFMV